MQKDKAEKRIKNIVEKKSRKVANEHLTQTLVYCGLCSVKIYGKMTL